MYRISKLFRFSAAHQLFGLPDPEHPCMRLHGHNYTVRLVLESTLLDPSGFVVDTRALGAFKKYLDEHCDHRNLNDLDNVGQTSGERLAQFFAIVFLATAPAAERLYRLREVEVCETDTVCATYQLTS